MINWIIRKQIDAFEREYDYDLSYAREVLATSTSAMMAFHKATSLGNVRGPLPPEIAYAAKLLAARSEDCGPCLQVCARLAESEGVSPDVIAAVLNEDWDAMSDDVALAARFALAVLARRLEIDELRAEVEARWGKLGVIALAFSIISARLYPPLKYALGYGKSCVAVEAGGRRVFTPRAQAA